MEIKGIDVSYHQGLIDWQKVKANGIKYVIIRAGYGKTQMDKKFIENICGANTAGIEVGIYWFIYAKDVAEAIENADRCHACISLYKGIIKHKVWADWEYDSDKRNPQNKASRTAIVKAFCERLEVLGYEVGVYANPDYIKSKFDMSQLSKYPLWLAKYSTSKGSYNPFMWQYSSKGSVSGIKGNVDMNIMYNSEPVINDIYYPVPTIKTGSIVAALNNIKVSSTMEYRKKIAAKNAISDYKGLYNQNIEMLDLLKNGKLKRV